MRDGVPEVQRAGGGDSVSQHAVIVPWAIAGIAFRNAMLVLYGGQRKCVMACRKCSVREVVTVCRNML